MAQLTFLSVLDDIYFQLIRDIWKKNQTNDVFVLTMYAED